jgi:hypothetical protein
MDAKRFVPPVVVGVVAAVGFGVWGLATRHTATPDVVEGWAMPNASGTAISLHDSEDAGGYIVAGASWAGQDGAWHEGSDGPTCIGTDTTAKTHVRLGIVHVSPGSDGIGGPHVVWLRCITG